MKQYIDKAAVVAEIEKRIKLVTSEKNKKGASQIDKLSLGGRIAGFQELKVFINTLEVKEEPVSKDLKKTARSYSDNIDNICGSVGEQTRNAFKAGAKWQEEQMIEKACEWLGKESDVYIGYYDKQGLIDNFKKAMEAEK